MGILNWLRLPVAPKNPLLSALQPATTAIGVPPPQGSPPERYPKDAYPPPGYPPPPHARGYPPPQYTPQYPQQQQQSQGSSKAGLMKGTEVGPWNKTGGLGDVLGGLPPAMAANENRVMTVCPRFDQYKDAWDTGVALVIKVGDRFETVRFFHCYKRGVDPVFVDHPMFLEKVWGKTASKIYGPKTGRL